ncbi:MAG: OPT family oligopeptide transporter [Oligoflexus sp.]
MSKAPQEKQKIIASQPETPLYLPSPGERQLTVRAILSGCLIGAIICSMNLYLGLRIGWTIGGSLMSAILAYAFFHFLKPRKPFGVLETNIAQTTASGAGSMASTAGFVAAIPALQISGFEMSFTSLFVWSLSVAFLGVNFAVPLRRQYVEIEKLRFPSGTATATTIMAMFATAGESLKKARVLIITGMIALAYTIAAFFYPVMEAPPLHQWTDIALLTALASWGFSIQVSPMLFGAGLLIGPRIGSSLLIGAIVGWGVLGVTALSNGWATHDNPMVIHDTASDIWGARGWILWPGVAIMVGDALMSLALSWKTFIRAFVGTKKALGDTVPADEQKGSQQIPNRWWISGLILGSLATIFISWQAFAIPPWMSLFAIILSAILANVAVRSTGETDINPIGGMGKVTQAAFGAITDSVSTNLLAGGITGAGASQAGDIMHDLKSGYLLRASPRLQFLAQLCGILAGVVFVVPIYLLFEQAWGIGTEGSRLAAPAAWAWKAVAEIMSRGISALPPFAAEAIVIGGLFGAALPLLRRWKPGWQNWIPSGMAFGIAFIVQAFYAIPMFLGSILLLYWKRRHPIHAERYVFAVACGLIAGEGVAGICNAILTLILR